MGTTGTSGDLTWSQAEALLLDQEFVLPPIPKLQQFLKMCNMKEYQCGILQICDYKGEPFQNPLPYCLFFNQVVAVTDWMVTGEVNKDGIFHTHAMFRTGARSDSLRRTFHTVWNNLMGSTNFREILGGRAGTMDCLKLQKCHKPESMMGYMMKNPIWVVATKFDYLEALWAIDSWGLNEKWKPKDDEPDVATDTGTMNKMTEDIIGVIQEYGCKNFNDCLRHAPLIMQKYLHRPGLQTIVNNCLDFVKCTGHTWSLSIFERHRPNPFYVHRVLLFQGIPPSEFDQVFFKWITKADPKRNTICLQGPSNTGKSNFIAGFKQCVTWGEIVNTPTFAFEALPDSIIGVWEEPLCSPELAEKAKQVLEGMATSIPIKHKKPLLLPRTPIIITSNHDLWRFCQAEKEMFQNRMWIFYFNYIPQDAVMFYRTSERSCKCSCCRASCSGEIAHGKSGSGRLQSREQSMVEPIRTEHDSEMGSGSMPGTGEGTSGSDSRPSTSTGGSTDSSSSDTRKSSSTAGDSAKQHVGTFRILRGDNTKHGLSTDGKHVESDQSRGHSRDDSNSVRRGSDGGRDVGHSLGGAGRFKEKYVSSRNVELPSQNVQKKLKTASYPKGSELDRYMEQTLEPYLPQMMSPSKHDWQEYLSYLFYRYG